MAAVKRYVGRFTSQFDGSQFASQNCTPASLANAVRSASKGSVDKTGAEVRALVKVSEEQNPLTPGWSLRDADLAATRLGVAFAFTKASWAQVRQRRAEGRMIVLQGDSDQFTSGCSSKFDGNHAIVLHPNDNDSAWLIGDPICTNWRWEDELTLRKYAEKFGGGSALFGYTSIVPVDEEAEVAVVITVTPQNGRYTIPAGKSIVAYKVDPTTGLVAERKTWPARSTPSSASYDARITTTAFKGNPFLRAVDGFFAGFWVSAGLVDEVPDTAPVTDCSQQIVQAKEAGFAEGIAEQSRLVRERLGI